MAGEEPAAKPKRPLPVRVGRAIAWALLGMVGVVAALLLFILGALRTRYVEEKIASIASEQVKKALAGRLALGQVVVRGALQVCVRDVELQDAQGVPAARAKSICASFEPLALLHKEVRVKSLALEGPEVFLTTVAGEDGVKTTSLQRAVAPREKRPETNESAGPFSWSIAVDALDLRGGAFEVRDAPGAAPKLAAHEVQLAGAKARYAASGAAARLSLTGLLQLAGEEKIQLALDAQLDGPVTRGRLVLRALEVHLGASGFAAEGAVDLATLSGALRLRELRLEPSDLERLLGDVPLSAELTGGAELTSDGRTARAAVHVETLRGGHIELTAQSTLAEPLRWSAKLETEHVDPAFVLRGAPEGQISLGLTLEGKGLPKLDARGVEGDVRGALHLGPAELEATGPLSADAEFSLAGRAALVKKLDADALSVHLRASGSLSLTQLGLELQIDAGDLRQFAHALGALEHQPPSPLSGSAQLVAHVTGSPQDPSAQVHLRSRALALGAGLRVSGLAIDGSLSGPLKRPRGMLTVDSKRMQLSGIGLGAPKILAQVDWPQAHLQMDAAVGGSRGDAQQKVGAVHLAGDASLDEDGDGALLSGFQITWPGNALAQARPTRVHFRPDETVLEPLLLAGKRGSISLEATVRPPPPLPHAGPEATRVDAKVALEKFQLAGLPAFALPPGLRLGGSIDLRAQMSGTTREPDVEATLSLRAVEVASLRGVDGDWTAQLEHDRLRAQGALSGLAGAKLALRADVPLEAEASPDAPVALDLAFGPLELALLPGLLRRQALFLAKPAGTVSLHATAQGTLAQPHAKATLEADGVEWGGLHGLGLRAGLVTDGGKARLDGTLSLAGTAAATLTAAAPFELPALLRKPSLFARLLDKPAAVKLRATNLSLERLAGAGILPAGSAGEVTAALDLDGTEAQPQLTLTATGTQLTTGALHKLDVALHLSAAQKLHLDLDAKPGGDADAKLDLDVQVASSELVAAARKGFSKESLRPLLERALSLQLDVAKLVLGRLAEGSAQPAISGELDGRVSGSGTPDAPLLKGTLTLREVTAGMHELGDAELYLEANRDGATLHLGLAPPSGRELLARQEEVEEAEAEEAEEAREAGKHAPARKPAPVAAPVHAASDDAAGEAAAAKVAAAKAAAPALEHKSGMTERGGGTFLGHAMLKAPLSARVLLEQGTAALTGGSLDGSVTMRSLDLTFLSGLTPLLRSTGGVIDGEVAVHGLLDRPEPKGVLHLRGGSFDVVGQGIFSDVSLDATLTPQEIIVERISGANNGGTFSGTVVLDRHNAASKDKGDQYQFAGELHAGDAESVRERVDAAGKPLVARPVPLRQAGQTVGELVAEADFFGDDTAGSVAATVKIPGAKLHVAALPDKKLPSLSPNPEILVYTDGEEPHPAGIDTAEMKKEKEAMAASNLRVDLKLDLQGLQVSADDFDFPVTSKMHVAWDARHPDQPRADGTVEVKGGTFSALGRRFSIDGAKITETGSDIADPELEIQARYENAQASVLVLVSGTAKNPQVDLSSSPPMGQDAIAFFLATGRIQGEATQQGSGVDLGNAATSVLGAMLFGKLRSNMAGIMPVDVVDIEAGGGDRPPQASVGKYIGDRIFVGYRQRFSPAPTENENEVTVEYEISRGLGTSATVGDKNQGVMVTWTKDF